MKQLTLISGVTDPLVAAILRNVTLFGVDRLKSVITEMVVNYFEGETQGDTVCHWLRTYELAWGSPEGFDCTIGLPLWRAIYAYFRNDVGLDPEEFELVKLDVDLGAYPACLIYRVSLLSRFNRDVLYYD